MNIDRELHDNYHTIYLLAMGENREDAGAYISKCQDMLDSGMAKPLFPWDSVDSAEKRVLGDALNHLVEIILRAWFSRYSALEMQTMCRLLARCPDGGFARVRVIEGLDLNVDDIIIRYNEMYPDANICLEGQDLG